MGPKAQESRRMFSSPHVFGACGKHEERIYCSQQRALGCSTASSGKKPTDRPVLLVGKVELIINLKVGKALGLKFLLGSHVASTS
jgi:hypothetical protein